VAIGLLVVLIKPDFYLSVGVGGTSCCYETGFLLRDLMAVRHILQLGNPTLRVNCKRVASFESHELLSLTSDLRDTLYDFESRHGFGRGIAAPQIGVTQRVIFIHVDEPVALVNPVIVKRDRKLMTLWDDCFSFPNLLVKVRRNISVEVRYQDENGKSHKLNAQGGLSELLQHEIDHINGTLAVDRAVDSKHIVFRSEYERWLQKNEQVVL
jgi:peptide deformylase